MTTATQARKESTIRQLVERYQRKDIPADAPERTIIQVAKAFGITRQFLYDILDGEKGASEETKQRMAKAMGLSEETVHRAIGRTGKRSRRKVSA